MPEVYTLRTPDSFRSSPRAKTIIVQKKRNAEMYHLRLNEQTRTPTYDLLKPSIPAQIQTTSKRNSTMFAQPVHRQKAEMYHLSARQEKTPTYHGESPSAISIHQQPKSNIVSNSHSPPKVTTYMITASNEGHFLPQITHTPSPLIRPTKKRRQVVSDEINHNDKYEILNSQRQLSIEQHRLLALPSKATDSIHRSMNMYRFRRN